MANQMTQAGLRPQERRRSAQDRQAPAPLAAKPVLAPVYPAPSAASLSPSLQRSPKTNERAAKKPSSEKFASLSPDMLARDSQVIITRPDAIDYSGQRASYAQPTRIAVTFRMECGEFQRLRKGAEKVGVKPRDVVNKAIRACLDAYEVKSPLLRSDEG